MEKEKQKEEKQKRMARDSSRVLRTDRQMKEVKLL